MKKSVLLLFVCVFSFLVLTGCQQLRNEDNTEIETKERESSASSVTQKSMLTPEEAIQIAVNHSNIASTEDLVTRETSASEKDGVTLYEIEFTVGQKEYEYEIQAYTGEILAYDYENKDRQDADETIQITIRKAKEIAIDWANARSDECVFAREEYREEELPPFFELIFLFQDKIFEFEMLSDGTVIECSMEKVESRQKGANQTRIK